MSYQRYREARLQTLKVCEELNAARLKAATADFVLIAAEAKFIDMLYAEQRIIDERRAGPFALYARWESEARVSVERVSQGKES